MPRIKTVLKIIVVMIIFQMTVIPISNAGYWGDIIQSGDQFLQDGSQSSSSTGSTEGDEIVENQGWINLRELKGITDQVYNILFALGVVLAVIIGAVLGIKFMIGSVDQQAKIKEALFPYITGCIVIFGAFGIWKIVVTLLRTI